MDLLHVVSIYEMEQFFFFFDEFIFKMKFTFLSSWIVLFYEIELIFYTEQVLFLKFNCFHHTICSVIYYDSSKFVIYFIQKLFIKNKFIERLKPILEVRKLIFNHQFGFRNHRVHRIIQKLIEAWKRNNSAPLRF